jgi:Mn-dependent DtxR family transcriptional regulator
MASTPGKQKGEAKVARAFGKKPIPLVPAERLAKPSWIRVKAGSGARLTDIAARMGVTKASANSAMAVLAEKGLIANEKYQEILLTPQGIAAARLVSTKHASLQRFFIEVLGVDPAVAESDACAIEHVISRETIEAVERYMKKPPKDASKR